MSSGVYDSVRAGSSNSALMENLQSQLKMRDGEIAQLQVRDTACYFSSSVGMVLVIVFVIHYNLKRVDDLVRPLLVVSVQCRRIYELKTVEMK